MRVKYLRQIIDTCFDPFCKLSPGDQELWFVFYEPRAFTKQWREGEVPIDSVLYSSKMDRHFATTKVSPAENDKAEATNVDVFQWSSSGR